MHKQLIAIGIGTLIALFACNPKPTAFISNIPAAKIATSQAATRAADLGKQVEGTANKIKQEAEQGKQAASQPNATQPVILHFENILNDTKELFHESTEMLALASRLSEVTKSLAQSQIDEQKMFNQYTDAIAAQKKAQDLYHDSWIGGKGWRCIWWITGITATLVIADTLLSIFAGIGINPITFILSLITKIFKFRISPNVGYQK